MKIPIPAFMEAFLLAHEPMPFNFVFAVRLDGRISPSDLRHALNRTAQRHPPARMRIAAAPDGTAWLDSQDVPEFPLRVVETNDSQAWLREILLELGSRFDAEAGPFVRLVCLLTPQGSDLLLTFNHPVCDGMSGLYFTRDFLAFLGNPTLELPSLPPIPGSTYDLLPPTARDAPLVRIGRWLISTAARTAWPLIRNLPRPTPPGGSQPSWQRFHVLTGRLDADQTRALIARCRTEKTTVHAALCAAWLRADSQIDQTKTRWHRRVSSAFSLRERLTVPVNETFGLFMGMATAGTNCHPRRSFWQVARALNRSLKRQTSGIHAYDWVLRTHAALIGLSPSQRREVLGVLSAQKPDYDLAVTNLGRLDWPSECGERRIEAVYGPLVNGFPLERTVCALTFDGRLHYAFLFRDFVLDPAQGERIRERAIELLTGAVT